MNISGFIAKRILSADKRQKKISTPIVKIAVGGIALGIAVMIITLAIVTGFQQEIRQKVTGFAADIQITSYDNNSSQEPAPVLMSEEFINSVKNVEGVRAIYPFAVKNGLIKTKTDNEGVLLKGVDKNYDWSFIKRHLKQGEVIAFSDSTASKQIIISQTTALRLGLNLNDKLRIYFITPQKEDEDSHYVNYQKRIKEFLISGIYETGLEEVDSKMAIVDMAQIQKLNYWDGNTTGGYEVLIENTNTTEAIAEEINDLCPPELLAQTALETNATLFSWLELQDVNAVIVIVLMLVVAAFNMVSALLILILERTNMIGILKALGAHTQLIQTLFLKNAAYLLLWGMLWGNVLGLSLCLLQKNFKIFTLPKETYYIEVIPIQLNVLHLALLNSGTLFICLIAMSLPSFIISKITPVKAIRFR